MSVKQMTGVLLNINVVNRIVAESVALNLSRDEQIIMKMKMMM